MAVGWPGLSGRVGPVLVRAPIVAPSVFERVPCPSARKRTANQPWVVLRFAVVICARPADRLAVPALVSTYGVVIVPLSTWTPSKLKVWLATPLLSCQMNRAEAEPVGAMVV